MKKYLLAILVGFLMFGAWLYITDDPSTAHFIEIGPWRWQIDRRYLWTEGPVVDVNELERLLDITEPNDVIIIGRDGWPEIEEGERNGHSW